MRLSKTGSKVNDRKMGVPDGTGPHGRGMGPGQGRGDGTGLNTNKPGAQKWDKMQAMRRSLNG